MKSTQATHTEGPASIPARSRLFRRVPGFKDVRASRKGGLIARGSRLLKTRPNNWGYLQVSIRSKAYFVHRLVLLAWVGPCLFGQQANHIDGNKLNNDVSNLNWMTQSENMNDARARSPLQRNRKNTTAETAAQVREMRALGYTNEAIAAQLDLHRKTVSNILTGRLVPQAKLVPDAP